MMQSNPTIFQNQEPAARRSYWSWGKVFELLVIIGLPLSLFWAFLPEAIRIGNGEQPQTIVGHLGMLLDRYWRFGKLFALFHLALALLLLWDSGYRKIWRESKTLESWDPQRGAPTGSGRLAQQLSLFLDESSRWAAHGVLVPLTDFSDRIDSLIEGIVDELHSRVNLFLVIGIAGTFFGLFGFALGAEGLLQGPNPEASLAPLSHALAVGLGNAFPVGFLGLFFTLLGHVAASSEEEKLRVAAAEATQRCLAARPATGLGDQIADVLRPVVDAQKTIAEALDPLRNLQRTLSETLEPVIRQFGQQLEQTGQVIQGQFDLLHSAVAGVESAVSGLAQLVAELRSVLRDVPRMLVQMAERASELQKAQTECCTALSQLQDATARCLSSLESASFKMQEFPTEARTNLEAAFRDVAAQCKQGWVDVARDYETTLAQIATNAVDGVQRSISEACDRLTNTSQEVATQLGQLAINARSVLENAVPAAIQTAVRELRGPLAELDQAFRAHYPQAVKDVTLAVQNGLELVGRAEQAVHHLLESVEQIEPALEAWQSLQKRLAECTVELKKASEASEHWTALRQDVLKVADKSQIAADTLRELRSTAQQVQQGLSELRGTVHGIHNLAVDSGVRVRPRFFAR
jgi:predicted transcriptional regulator